MDEKELISKNLAEVRERAARASRGREITLVCVTKYVDARIAGLLVAAGADHIGETRIIDAARKIGSLRSSGLDFTAHMIGPVQSNKAKEIPGAFDWCQSLSRVKIADILEKSCQQRGAGILVTLEVNIGDEPQKEGVTPEEIEPLLERILSLCPSLTVRGLMCIPPVAGESETRAHFSRMRDLYEDTGKKYSSELDNWDTLSMGMSRDFTWAVEEGATMVRVGSVLFDGIPGFSKVGKQTLEPGR